jgi:hypothetical protein
MTPAAADGHRRKHSRFGECTYEVLGWKRELRRISSRPQESKMHATRTGLAAVAAVLLSLAAPAQVSAAADSLCPPGNSGYILWDVSTEPYRADNIVDEQGNDDGFACARPGKVVTDEDGNPFQFYNFIDNRVPLTAGG